MRVFKDIAVTLEIETNLKEADFLDISVNLRNGTYRPYKKPNEKLKNSSNEEKFNTSKR